MRLTALAPLLDDKFARSAQRDVAAEIIFGQGKGKVDPGRNASRCPELVISNEDPVCIQPDARKEPGKAVSSAPVRCGPSPFQQADHETLARVVGNMDKVMGQRLAQAQEAGARMRARPIS
ncbi:hypothetical protein [Hyphomonas sp.]|uniref:hypothetical protein n=1 Tax=Hyphomonas sp. TaxID=87 RepID=UPI00260421B9|nr:hypothetical protein [Hyphomonas sp.]